MTREEILAALVREPAIRQAISKKRRFSALDDASELARIAPSLRPIVERMKRDWERRETGMQKFTRMAWPEPRQTELVANAAAIPRKFVDECRRALELLDAFEASG